MSVIQCKCGSTNCTLIPWNARKAGAKKGGLGGAVIGGLIGLAGGPIGAIAGAAIGAAGGAVVGEKQPTDNAGRLINQYKCNSCGKKFQVCPKCQNPLSYSTDVQEASNGRITYNYCCSCHNLISKSFQANMTDAQRNAIAKGSAAYSNAVRNNLNRLVDDDGGYDDYE